MPETSCICFSESILSFNKNDIIAQGKILKATPTKNVYKTESPPAYLSFKIAAVLKLTVVTSKVKLGLPVADFKIDSYIN